MAKQAVNGGRVHIQPPASAMEPCPRCGELEALVERFHESLSALEVLVVDGYLVKVWPDAEDGGYVAECPTVQCVSQGETRDEALAGVKAAMQEMVSGLADLGHPPPPKDA